MLTAGDGKGVCPSRLLFRRSSMGSEHDWVVRNGQVIDGTGRPAFVADVALVGDRISAIGPTVGEGKQILDAAGLIVAPGFIDMHSHSAAGNILEPRPESHLTQGVTTEVGGNCGSSFAPRVAAEAEDPETRYFARFGYRPTWRTLGEMLTLLEEGGLLTNFLTYVGQGTVRGVVMGWEERPPTPEELRAMQREVEQALEEGAWGLSTGLIYPPGCYARPEEIVALAQVAARRGGIYATHLRNEGDYLLLALTEAIEIGRQAEIPVQVSHHKAVGKANWGKVEQTLAQMEAARAEGVEITCDQYPYLAGSTTLKTLLPPWAHAGGTEALLERLRDPDTRTRLTAELSARFPQEEDWQRVFVSEVVTEARKDCEGRNLWEIAQAEGVPPVEALFQLLLEDEAQTGMISFGMCEADVEMVMRYPGTMIGADAMARATKGPLRHGKPHPRTFGTFARILGEYTRERGLLTWEEAIRKMTSQPAEKLGLPQRGVLRPGYFADLVVFDPHTIRDQATYADPYQLAVGL
ncbi:MAG TPA: D-aminoacylase, partial [Armatimonadetes bacterium]|nr:D-aminoacylase [Armatimonadota bacterium]